MSITKKQGLAIALILLAGLLAGAGILLDQRREAVASAKSGMTEPEHEEGKVEIKDEQARQAGIDVQVVGPARLKSIIELPGEIRFDEDRTAHIVPRLAGVAERVSVNLGQTVRQGDVLAVIASTALSEQRSDLLAAQRRRDAARVIYEREKALWEDRISAEQDYLQAEVALQEADIAVRNATQKLAAIGAAPSASSTGALNRFELRAPFDGTVVEKHLTLGEAVRDDTIVFTLSDLRHVWAEFQVAPRDLSMVRIGQRVTVSSTAFDGTLEGTVAYVGSLVGERTRSAMARVTLKNPDGAWRPGLFVTVSLLAREEDVPLAVPVDAVQTIEGRPSVFAAVPDGFRAMPITVGRSDSHHVEVLAGIAPGDRVAVRNAFVLKSELGKDTAGHAH